MCFLTASQLGEELVGSYMFGLELLVEGFDSLELGGGFGGQVHWIGCYRVRRYCYGFSV